MGRVPEDFLEEREKGVKVCWGPFADLRMGRKLTHTGVDVALRARGELAPDVDGRVRRGRRELGPEAVLPLPVRDVDGVNYRLRHLRNQIPRTSSGGCVREGRCEGRLLPS